MRSRIPTLILAGIALGGQPSAARQVGHRPESSPYRDLRIKQTVTVLGGFLSGGRGTARVGPSEGPLAGLRWDFHVGSAATLFLGAAASNLERQLVNPNEPPETRYFDTANQQVFLLDGGINFMLTGRKTWRGLAPYLGAAIGMAFGGAVPEDTLSGFRFGSKFQIGPLLGLRIFPNRRIHLRIEAQDILWRLTYPARFFEPPADAPTIDPVLDPAENTNGQWTHHPTIRFGLGYTIRI